MVKPSFQLTNYHDNYALNLILFLFVIPINNIKITYTDQTISIHGIVLAVVNKVVSLIVIKEKKRIR